MGIDSNHYLHMLKFIIFIAAICAAYFLFVPPKNPDNTVGGQELRAAQKASEWSWNTVAVWVLVVVTTGSIARTVFQSKTRVGVTKEMYRLAKEERVVGYDHGTDEGGNFHSIQTQDGYGTEKYYTTVDVDKLK